MREGIVITGCSSGLGFEVAKLLYKKNFWISNKEWASLDPYIFGVFERPPLDSEPSSKETVWHEYVQGNLNDTTDVARVVSHINRFSKDAPVTHIINCAGANVLTYLEDLRPEDWDKVMNVNARAIYLLAQGFLPTLKEHKGVVFNILSRAAYRPMTASLTYNASKAAAQMVTLQLARELTRRYGITVMGLAPRKIAGTAMTAYTDARVCELRGWTPEEMAKHQQDSQLTKDLEASTVADFIVFLLSTGHCKNMSGCIVPYGG